MLEFLIVVVIWVVFLCTNSVKNTTVLCLQKGGSLRPDLQNSQCLLCGSQVSTEIEHQLGVSVMRLPCDVDSWFDLAGVARRHARLE